MNKQKVAELPISYGYNQDRCTVCGRNQILVTAYRGSTPVLWNICEQCIRNTLHAFEHQVEIEKK